MVDSYVDEFWFVYIFKVCMGDRSKVVDSQARGIFQPQPHPTLRSGSDIVYIFTFLMETKLVQVYIFEHLIETNLVGLGLHDIF